MAFGSAYSDERILSFDSDIEVQEDGSMFVTETIVVRAEGKQIKRGIYRDFPTTYTTRGGDKYIVDFNVLGVTKDQAPEPYFTESRSNGVRVYIGRKSVRLPVNREYTYQIKYYTDRQLGFYQRHDELYWNVTGNAWGFPIDSASAKVVLPSTIRGETIRVEGFTGFSGQTGQDYRAKVNELGEARFGTIRSLIPGEGLTIVVTWPKGHVREPSTGDKIGYFLGDNKSLLVGVIGGLLVLIYYLFTWVKVGRDPDDGTIIPLFEPPGNLSPAAMRYIYRMGFDNKAYSAAIINMAVKGYLTITDSDDTYEVNKNTDASESVLSSGERMIVNKLFAGGQSAVFEKSNHSKIKKSINVLKALLKKEYQRNYFKTNGWYLVPGVLVSFVVLLISGLMHGEEGVALIMMSVWLSGWTFTVFILIRQRNYFMTLIFGFFELTAIGAILGMGSWSLVILLFTLIGINILFFYLIKAPTETGRKLMDKIEGFRLYLATAEEHRLNALNPPRQTPQLFEKYLPYALALGVDQAWSERFSATLSAETREPGSHGYRPRWYSGSNWNQFNPTGFSSDLGSSLSKAVASSSVAPGSSSGSGGGGSSGGGGGGGGGGGW